MFLCPGNPGQHHHHHRPLPLQRPLHLHQPPQQPRRHRHHPVGRLPGGLRAGEAGGGHGVVHPPHTGGSRHQGLSVSTPHQRKSLQLIIAYYSA